MAEGCRRSRDFIRDEIDLVVGADLRPETDLGKIRANDERIKFLEELLALVHVDALVGDDQSEALKKYIGIFCEVKVGRAERARDLLLLASNLNAWK